MYTPKSAGPARGLSERYDRDDFLLADIPSRQHKRLVTRKAAGRAIHQALSWEYVEDLRGQHSGIEESKIYNSRYRCASARSESLQALHLPLA